MIINIKFPALTQYLLDRKKLADCWSTRSESNLKLLNHFPGIYSGKVYAPIIVSMQFIPFPVYRAKHPFLYQSTVFDHSGGQIVDGISSILVASFYKVPRI